MSKIFLPFILLLFQVISTSISAQVSSTTSNFKVATAYSSHDSIFIFNQAPASKKGSLSVTTPGGGPATFEWSVYDTTNYIFLPAFQTDTNVEFSVASDLNAGGYQIHATKPGLDTTIRAWVFLNDFTFSVEKNNNGEVHFYRRTCEFTNLQANIMPVVFKYFDPSTANRLILKNPIIVTWTANPSNGVTLGEGSKIWIEGEDLPTEDTEYTGRATDKFNLSKEDKVKYISIIPKADFDTTFERKYGDKISAPLSVVLTNNSENAIKYSWIFGDGDTLNLMEPSKDPEPHNYYQSNKTYTIKLIVESKEGCIREDTVSFKVDESILEAPNFFSPGGANPTFRIYNLSLREFHITIFTRSGRKVYEFHGPDINHWEGWDGNIGSSPASPGIYYYVIEAISWEIPSVKYEPTKKSSFFYLFRDK